MNSHIPDHDSARAQLSAAAAGDGGGTVISRSAAASGRAFAIAVGVLIGGFLLAVVYIFPAGFTVLSLGVIVAYGLGLVSAIVLHRRRRASGLGWNRRYAVGATLSISLYAVGVAVNTTDTALPEWFWIVFAIIVALPLVIAGLVRASQ